MVFKTFEQLRGEQLHKLSHQINIGYFGETGKNKFYVYPYEASLGKTYTLIDALKSIQKHDRWTKTLVVSKFIGEGNTIASKIPNAIAINSDVKINEDTLSDYDVVIITHQKYKMLCKDFKRREKYIDGRKNLIIDEELNLLNMDEFSSREISRMETILRELSTEVELDEQRTFIDLGTCYKEIIAGLEKEKNKYIANQMRFFYYDEKDIIKRIDDLQSMVKKVKFTDNYLKHLKFRHKITTDKKQVEIKLEMLKKYYSNPNVIAQSKTLYTYDSNIRYFTLDNNIILDASAKFHTLYSNDVSDMFKVVDADRIVDHSNWNVHLINKNSTASAKHNDDNYYNYVVGLINEHTTTEDEILILGLEEDMEILKGEHFKSIQHLNVHMENFQAMRGKNNWESCNKCFIIHNPMINYAYYVFEYLLYSGKQLTDEDLLIQKISKNKGFKNNDTLESLRKTDIASNIYQGIKRISRGAHQKNKTDVYIMNSDEEIMNMVTEQLKDANIKIIEKVKTTKPRKKRNQESYNNKNRKSNSAKSKLADVLGTLKSGKYEISDLLEKIDYKNSSNFSKLWNDKIIAEIVNKRNIETVVEERKYVIIP